MTSKEEMLTYPHADGTVSYLKHGWKGWDSPGPVDEADVEVSKSSCPPLCLFWDLFCIWL